jgi:hypothetical protein
MTLYFTHKLLATDKTDVADSYVQNSIFLLKNNLVFSKTRFLTFLGGLLRMIKKKKRYQ